VIPEQEKDEAALERVLNQRGMVTCRVLPAIRGTVGVKEIVLLELAPVMRLLLAREHELITEGQN